MYTELRIAIANIRNEHLEFIDKFDFVYEYKDITSRKEIFSRKAEGIPPDAVGLYNDNSIFLTSC